MITLHSRQSDHARHARKNENAGTVNFITQIAPSICTAMNTKRVKTDATIFKPRCSRTGMCYRLDRVQALLLSFVRFFRLANSSPVIQRSPARRSCNVREPSGKMSRPFPNNFPAIAGQWQMQCRRISARATRETTRNMARNSQAASASQTAQHPVKHLTGRLVEFFSSRF